MGLDISLTCPRLRAAAKQLAAEQQGPPGGAAGPAEPGAAKPLDGGPSRQQQQSREALLLDVFPPERGPDAAALRCIASALMDAAGSGHEVGATELGIMLRLAGITYTTRCAQGVD